MVKVVENLAMWSNNNIWEGVFSKSESKSYITAKCNVISRADRIRCKTMGNTQGILQLQKKKQQDKYTMDPG